MLYTKYKLYCTVDQTLDWTILCPENTLECLNVLLLDLGRVACIFTITALYTTGAV